MDPLSKIFISLVAFPGGEHQLFVLVYMEWKLGVVLITRLECYTCVDLQFGLVRPSQEANQAQQYHSATLRQSTTAGVILISTICHWSCIYSVKNVAMTTSMFMQWYRSYINLGYITAIQNSCKNNPNADQKIQLKIQHHEFCVCLMRDGDMLGAFKFRYTQLSKNQLANYLLLVKLTFACQDI